MRGWLVAALGVAVLSGGARGAPPSENVRPTHHAGITPSGRRALGGRVMKRTTGTLAPEQRGALFEGMVAQLIRAYKDYHGICDEMYYWAPSGRSGTEVDLLLVRGENLIAVGTKSGAMFTEAWCKGLRAVTQLKGLQRRIVVYPSGPVLRTEDGIDVLPLPHFATLLAGNNL